MNKIFAETYQSDIETVERLGLREFTITIKTPECSVRVYVTAMPAQFLSRYEHLLVDLSNGMIVAKDIS